MFRVKKLICCLVICMLLSLLTACSLSEFIDKQLTKFKSTDETNSTNSETRSVDQIVIEALENQDADAIKGLFSVRTKELCTDLDEGIEYMLSIYEGEYIQCTQHNQGAEKHQTRDGNTCIVRPVCVFQTTEHYYKLSWNQWTENEKDEEEVGVYSMQLEVWPDAGLNQGGADLNIAGIVYPTNVLATDMAWYLWKIIYQNENTDNDKDVFRNLLSDHTLATGISDDMIARFFDETEVMRYRLGDGWIEYDTDGNITVYLLSNTDSRRCVCFGMDYEQPDKISFVKVVDVGDEKAIGDFNLAEEEPGIYLPD